MTHLLSGDVTLADGFDEQPLHRRGNGIFRCHMVVRGAASSRSLRSWDTGSDLEMYLARYSTTLLRLSSKVSTFVHELKAEAVYKLKVNICPKCLQESAVVTVRWIVTLRFDCQFDLADF